MIKCIWGIPVEGQQLGNSVGLWGKERGKYFNYNHKLEGERKRERERERESERERDVFFVCFGCHENGTQWNQMGTVVMWSFCLRQV